MKKVISLFLVFALCIGMISSVSASTTDEKIELAETIKTPFTNIVGNPSTYTTVDGTDFNKKSGQYNDWYGFGSDSASVSRAFAEGRSGEAGDYAHSVSAKSISELNTAAHSYENTKTIYVRMGDTFYNMAGTNEIVTEFDIKPHTEKDIIAMNYLQTWIAGNTPITSYALFGSNGKIGGTSYEYDAGKWYHLKLSLNPTTSKWNVWVTDENGITSKIVDNASRAGTVPYLENKFFFLSLIQPSGKEEGETPAGYTLDNLKFYMEELLEDSIILPVENEVIVAEGTKFSANVGGCEKVEFLMNGEVFHTFTSPDSVNYYTYSVTASNLDMEDGENIFSVRKTVDSVASVVLTKKVRKEIVSDGTIELAEPTRTPFTNIVGTPSTYTTVDGTDFNRKSAQYNDYYGFGSGTGVTKSYVEGRSGEATDLAHQMVMNSVAEANTATHGWEATKVIYTRFGDTFYNMAGEKNITAEFDIKPHTEKDIVVMYFLQTWMAGNTPAQSYALFGSDGKVGGTSYEYDAGKWYHFKLSLNPVTTKWNVWITDENEVTSKIVDNAPRVGAVPYMEDKFFTLSLIQPSGKAEGETPAGYTLDNLKFYMEEESSEDSILLPEKNAVVTEDSIEFSATASGCDKVEFLMNGEVFQTFQSPDNTKCYEYSIIMKDLEMNLGSNTFSVRKTVGNTTYITMSENVYKTGDYVSKIQLYKAPDVQDSAYMGKDSTTDFYWYPNRIYTNPVKTRNEFYYGRSEASDVSLDIETGPSGNINDTAAHYYFTGTNKFAGLNRENLFVYLSSAVPALNALGGTLNISLDIKTDTAEDAISLHGIPTWNNLWTSGIESTYIIAGNGPDGKPYISLPGDTADNRKIYSIEVGTWYHLDLKLDMENKIYNVWISDVVGNSTSGTVSYINKKHIVVDDDVSRRSSLDADYKRIALALSQVSERTEGTKAGFWFDNWQMYRTKSLPVLTVEDDSENAVITMDKAYDALNADVVELKINGSSVALSDSDISYQDKVLTVKIPANAPSGANVEVIITEEAKIDEVPVGAKYVAKFTIIGDELSICEIDTSDAESISAKLANGTGKDVSGTTLYFATYNSDKELTDIVCIPYVTIKENINIIGTKIAAGADETVKVFIWDGIKPLCVNGEK